MLPELRYFYAIYRRNQHHTLNSFSEKKDCIFLFGEKRRETYLEHD